MSYPPITEVAAKDLKVGMVRQWNEGTSTIYKIERVSPRSPRYKVSFQSDTVRPDGKQNTITLECGGYLPIHTDSLAGKVVTVKEMTIAEKLAAVLAL